MKLYGYDGISRQRVTAFDMRLGKRKVLCWGDDITDAEIAPFVDFPHFRDVMVEPIDDPAAEAVAHPQYAGVA